MTTLLAPPLPPPSVAPTAVSPDDLLTMDGLHELTDGRLLEKRLSYDANWTVGQITVRLNAHLWDGQVRRRPARTDVPLLPPTSRRSSAGRTWRFIAAGRVPSPRPSGHVGVRPDLAVEVTSPNDEVDELELKLADYRSAGIPLVWVVLSAVRLVRVLRLDGSVTHLRDGDRLDGGTVLPGFTVAVSDLFPAVTTPREVIR